MRTIFCFRWLLVSLPLLVASCGRKEDAQVYQFESAPAAHRLNLARLLGEQLTLISATDTLNLKVRFERGTRTSLVLHARTGDTLLRGWATRYRGLYYFTQPLNDSSYWVHAWRRSGSTVQGLTDDWQQMLALRHAANKGVLPPQLVRRVLRDDTLFIKRLRYNAAQLRPVFETLVDSCPRYRLQTAVRNRPSSALVKATNLLCSLYPNPAQDWVSVGVSGSAAYSIELLNPRGQRILVRQDSAASVRLPLQQLAAGTYVLRVQDAATRHTITRRLIRQ